MNITCKLAGLSHRPAEVKKAVADLTAGSVLTLTRDPENKFDRNAIKVWSGPLWVGFLPAAVAARIAPSMDIGHIATCTVDAPTAQFDAPVLVVEIAE